MKKLARVIICALFASCLATFSITSISAAPATSTLTTCTSLKTGAQYLSATGKCSGRIYERSTWYQKGLAPVGTAGSKLIVLNTCTSKSKSQTVTIRKSCNSVTQDQTTWQRPLGPPSAPTIQSVKMGVDGRATISLNPPTDDGGARIISYTVVSSPGKIKTVIPVAQIQSVKISGLTPGIRYSFTATANNGQGNSVVSEKTVTSLAPTISDAPAITKVISTGTNSAQLSFSAPAFDGGSAITSYLVTAYPGGLQTTIYQSGSGTVNISNLSPSTSYTFTITAINAAGRSVAQQTPSPVITQAAPVPEEYATPYAPVDSTIATAAIAGVTAPVKDAVPTVTISATLEYTAVISWSGSPSTFATATVYTATITLAPKTGYTLTGVTANFFTVSGATATNSANSGVITAVFPATAVGAPAFTLSATSETQTVSTAVTGFTVTSTGGAIASFAISPFEPAGMSFNTITGTFSGTPIAVQSATTYTITATNSAGSANQTFSLTVSAGAPAKVIITRVAVGTQRRASFITQPQITIQDSGGNTAISSNAVITATISLGGTFVGAETATAINGVATFSDLGIDGTIGNSYTLTFSAVGLTVDTVSVTVSGTTCDGISFTCQVGDTGPGGGTVFYVAAGNFTQQGATASMCSSACKYLEAAPTEVTATRYWTDAAYVWSGNTTTLIGVLAQGTAIGTGYQNTLAIVGQAAGGDIPGKAGTISQAYRGPNNLMDWYLPSKDELNEFYLQKKLFDNVPDRFYFWSSSENSATYALGPTFSSGYQYMDYKSASTYVRPIRAFGIIDITISIAAIAGVTAPVAGATPVTTVTAGTGYTGTVTWASSSGALSGNFVATTSYTATITLAPTSGYTLKGVIANFFTVAGATSVTHSDNSGTITAIFIRPATYCDGTSFTCQVGDTGPGGGKIFFVKSVGAFTKSYVVPGFGLTGRSTTHTVSLTAEQQASLPFRYLELAPTQGASTLWGSNGLISGGTSNSIGAGSTNTQHILTTFTSDTASNNAAIYADQYVSNMISDWFLPSYEELLLVIILNLESDSGGPSIGTITQPLWSSSVVEAGTALTSARTQLIGYVTRGVSGPGVLAIREIP